MSKPASVSSIATFLTWRTAFNSLLSIAAEVVESANAPTVNDDITLYEMGTLWVHTTPNPNTAYILVDNTDGAAVWIQLGATPGALKNDGTVPLIADWDAGSHYIQALRFISDVTTGTAPISVTSTTACTNLNADLLDGYHAADLITTLNSVLWTLDTTDTDLAVALGDRRLVSGISASRDRDLPLTFVVTGRDIIIYNADDASDVLVDPGTGNNIILDGTNLGAAAKLTLAPATGVRLVPSVADTTWIAWTLNGSATDSNAVLWTLDTTDTAVSILAGDRRIVSGITVDRDRDLPLTFAVTNQDIILYNADDASSVLVDPGTGNNIILDGTDLGAAAKLTLGPATGVRLVPTVADTTWRAWTIGGSADNGVTNTKLADMAAYTLKVRNAGTTGDPSDTKVSGLTEITTTKQGWVLGENSSGAIGKIKSDSILINDFTVKLASFTAEAGKRYFVETDTGAGSAADVIVTLPTPVAGDIIEIFHVGVGAVNAVNEGLELEPTASYRIMGGTLGDNLVFDVNQTAVRIVYLNGTYGWRVAVL